MGLFNPHAVFLSDVNLLIQLANLVVLIVALSFSSRHIIPKHGAAMGIAVALHTVSIFAVMVPSLAAISGLFENLLAPFTLAMLAHAALGSLVELLGLYLVAAWALNHWNVKVCFGNKRLMTPTIILWFIQIAFGVYVYIALYVPI